MYDMYPWNRPAASSTETTQGAQAAVQIALDRRDNGGAAAAAAHGGDAAGAVAAAHRPTAGATPQ